MTLVPEETMSLCGSWRESRSNRSGSASPSVPSLTLGSEIGGYKLLRRLGRGGQGEVFEARSLEQGAYTQTVAIKIAPAWRERSDEPCVLAEARRLMGLYHPGIVRVFGAGRVNGWQYCVMERIQGVPLRTLLSKAGTLPASVSLEIAIKLCDALTYLHGQHSLRPAQAMLHRDLKPGNVMVNAFGEVKLIDFGISCSLQQVDWSSCPTYGTPAYMAPEQLSNERQGPPTDLFPVGVMLYEMMTGRRMYVGGGAKKLLAKRLAARARPVRRLEKSTGCRLMDQVITRSIAPKLTDRYESAGLLGRVLHLATRHRVSGPSLAEFFRVGV